MNSLFVEKFFYHVYPLGMSGAPKRNDFSCAPGNFFEAFTLELDRLVELGVNALYIGPLFESTSHGYDTLDYFYVDRRLGNNQKFADFCRVCHQKGISVVLDGVFNHTGRDFFAFKDLIQNGKDSIYKDWYLNLNFDASSCYGDGFDYEGWAGCKDLVKLNVDNPEVKSYLFSAIEKWIKDFDIDGLRLDAADVLSGSFMDDLSAFCKGIKNDFWLMGEVVHGDYNNWAHKGRLDSVTNYQIYKSLWSALNEKNMFELAYNLNREFGITGDGLYKNLCLYNFVDNHDVNRIAATIKSEAHLHLVYALLFTIPGIPSVYYHSEYGILGQRGKWDDFDLRPCVPPFSCYSEKIVPRVDSKGLVNTIKKFAKIRQENLALQKGTYRELMVKQEQLVFSREFENQHVIVCVNSSCKNDVLCINSGVLSGTYIDLLTQEKFHANDLKGINIGANWLRILKKD